MSPEPQPVSDVASDAGQPADRIDSTYRQLRELIVEGGLAPGTRVVEADLARRLGVSRTPVRSALHRLQQEGYVIPSNGGNVRTRLIVAPLTAEDASDLFNIVAELEGLAGRYAAHLPDDERSELTANLDGFNARLLDASRADRPEANTVFDLDSGIHRRLVEAAAPPRLLALHAAIKPQAERYSRVYIAALMEEFPTSVDEHSLIIQTIRMGDGDAAQRAIQTNWRNAAQRFAEAIANWGERGSW
jgi:DNA-binding GntR family transcriptional regulator